MVPSASGMGVAPLFRGLAKEGVVEQVRFVRIGERRLSFGDSALAQLVDHSGFKFGFFGKGGHAA